MGNFIKLYKCIFFIIILNIIKNDFKENFMNKSLWQKDVTIPSFEKLKKDTKVDVLIIGGGICGILCAYFLHKANINYLLVEKDKICCGTSGFTTGKITSLHGLIYSELIKKKGFI